MTLLGLISLFLLPTATAVVVEAPRKAYNAALAKLEAKDLDAAEKGFLDARDRAGIDDELRFRAAFDLALTYAARGEALAKEKPEDALAALRSAAAWFRDAVRQRPAEPDARANLEIVLRRVQALADELNRKAGTLEARLDRLIDDQRGLRDEIRGLVARIGAAGAKADPIGFEESFRVNASWERVLLSEAGAVASLAGDDAGHLEAKPKEEQTDRDRLRAAQLRALVEFVDRARQRMADARSLLQKLQGDAAHRRAEAALAELKRAREQLLDPVAILKACVGDELVVRDQTAILAGRGIPVTVTGGARRAAPPPWLTSAYLEERQRDVNDRAGELAARLEAGAKDTKAATGDPASLEERRAARTVAAAREALPHLKEAGAAMAEAGAALGRSRANEALSREEAALEALVRALERFSGVRELVELAYSEQSAVGVLLDPTATAEVVGEAVLSTGERARRVGEAVARNRERLERLKGLFQQEVAGLPPRKPPAAGEPPERDPERERYERAEAERQAAADTLGRLEAVLKLPLADDPPLPIAREGLERLESLRRLFFTIVEHLEELLRAQARTRDETASAAGKSDPGERKRAAAPVAAEEERHAETAKAIAKALSEQARAATPTPTAGAGAAPEAAQAAAKLAQAGDEVVEAARAMDSAINELSVPEPGFEAALGHEKDALERLAAAIALLKPPQQQDQRGEEQRQGAGEEKKQDEQAVSREQAQRRLQGVRDREAERRQDARRRSGRSAPEPVERDW